MSRLFADVHLAQAIPVVPQVPLPYNLSAVWTPTTSTLIHSENEAVLIDPLFTKIQSADLAEWVAQTIGTKTLKYIYITHGHGDHFFGIPGILSKFPSAIPIATKAVLKHMEEQSNEGWPLWQSWFPGDQIEKPDLSKVQILDETHTHDRYPSFSIDDHKLHAVPVGHADTNDSTVLWSPDLKLVVAGDAVYNGGFQYMAESLTAEAREAWIQAVETVKSLGPQSVVTGHKRMDAIDGAWTLGWTQEYIRTWGEKAKEVKRAGGGALEMFERMRKAFPDNTGEFILWASSLAQFPPK